MLEANAELKERVRQFWQEHPCGTKFADAPPGSKRFYELVEAHRYEKEWHIPTAAGFAETKNLKVLEIGCGLGTDGAQFASAGAEYTGVDLTDAAIELAQKRFELFQLPGTFRVADAEQLDFADNTFDIVYSHGVLHHTPDTAGAIREVHRVLRPGGVAKIMLYHRHSWNYWFEIILRRGVLGLEFLRGRSAEEIMSRVIEFSDHDARPLVKVYSRGQARELFGMFKDVRVDVEQLMRTELRLLSPLITDAVFEKLRTTIGWNVIVTAIK